MKCNEGFGGRSDKWAEAIGQALYYAAMTGRKPGIVVIMEKPTDSRYLKRLRAVTEGIPIKVLTVR